MATAFVNLYTVLGIAQDATPEQVKSAVKEQRKTWVPRQTSPSRELEREAQDQLARIREAEKTLLDAAKRAAHDQEIAAYVPPVPERRPAPEAGGDSVPEQRDWAAEAADHLRHNRPEAAAGAAREATDRDGSDHVAWAMRGRASLRLNQADSAIFEFGESVRLRPGSDEYHSDLGSAYAAKRDYPKAVHCYRTAQRLAPAVRQYPISIASVFLQDDKPAEALDILVPLQAADPADQLCNYLLAVAFQEYTFNTWTQVDQDGSIITTREQAVVTRQNMKRALALAFDDDDVRERLGAMLAEADKAERTVFRLPGKVGCLTVFLYLIVLGILLAVLQSSVVVGLPLLAVAGYGWYRLAFKPRWKRNASDLASLRVAQGSNRGSLRG